MVSPNTIKYIILKNYIKQETTSMQFEKRQYIIWQCIRKRVIVASRCDVRLHIRQKYCKSYL